MKNYVRLNGVFGSTKILSFALIASLSASCSQNGGNSGEAANSADVATVKSIALATGVPLAPSSFSAVSSTATSVTLKWAAVSGATGYIIQSKATDGTAGFEKVAQVGNVTTYNNTGLNHFWDYTYEVFAVNASGQSGPSGQLVIQVLGTGNSATAGPAPTPSPTVAIPAAPSDLKATSPSTTSVALSWSPVSGATGYIVESKATNGTAAFTQVAQVGAVTTYTNTGLNYIWQYTYEVIAVNSAGNSAPSESVTIQVVGDGAAASPSPTVKASPTSTPTSTPTPTATPTPTTLAVGTYVISSGADSLDGGFGYFGDAPGVQTYATASDNLYQEWEFTSSGTLENVGFSGHFMQDAKNGTVNEETAGDIFDIVKVSNGYTVKDVTSGNYLSITSAGALEMSSTESVWSFVLKSAAAPSPSPTVTSTPTSTPTSIPTSTPTSTPTATPTGPAQVGTVLKCTDSSSDAAMIQNALNAGGVYTVSGNCSLTSTITANGSGWTLQGSNSPVLHATGVFNIIQSTGNNNTLGGSPGAGLVFNGGNNQLLLNGGSAYTTTSSGGQSGWNISYNTFEDDTSSAALTSNCGDAAGEHGVGPSAGGNAISIVGASGVLGNSAGKPTVISHNTFSNIWAGGFPSNIAVGIDCLGGSGIYYDQGIDNVTIDSNYFTEIGYEGIKGFQTGVQKLCPKGDCGYGPPPYQARNVTMSNNEFNLNHRMAMETNESPQNSIANLVLKGNYCHDMVPQGTNMNNAWCYSWVFSSPAIVINNAAIQNVSTGYTAEAYEMGLNGGTFQGNVAEATTGGVGWGAYYCGISTQPGVVNKLENNIFCGPEGVYGTSLPTADSYFTTTTNYKGGGFHEPWDLATYEASANYYPGLICPDSAHMTTSNMVMGFVSANNQSLGGGTGTWSVYVTSMLPVRNVSFYVDGSSTPIVAPQELQDVNSAFATTHQWLYHATFSTSSLSAGSHTIKAVATDVTKTTQTVSQTFSR